MTQSPLPPPLPPREPLDESERALARALRNLPVGAPPPELDARILGAARRAVHLAPTRKSNRFWLVGFGTAASALLAVGLMVKTHPGQDETSAAQDAAYAPPATAISVVPAAAASAAAGAPAADADADAAPAPIAESKEAPAEAFAPSGNASPVRAAAPAQAQEEPALQQARQITGAPESAAAKKVPEAFPIPAQIITPQPAERRAQYAPAPKVQSPPPAPMPPVVMDEITPMAAPAPPPAPPPPQALGVSEDRKASPAAAISRDEEAYSDADATAPTTVVAAPPAAAGAAVNRPAPAKPGLNAATSNAIASSPALSGALKSDQAASAPSDAAAARSAPSLDRVEVMRSRTWSTSREKDAVLPAVDDDAKLTPRKWIDRIRARVKAADGEGARASLRLYRARYPDADIPDDLQPLLQ